MTIITLYTGGGVSFSPNYEEGRTESACVRLVADEGMMLVKGDIAATCVDVPRAEAGDWQEVEYVEPEELDDSEALDILLGGDGT